MMYLVRDVEKAKDSACTASELTPNLTLDYTVLIPAGPVHRIIPGNCGANTRVLHHLVP